jgi:hypothetical protein
MLLDEARWELQPPKELAAFFTALPELADDDAILCLGAGAWHGDLAVFLDANQVEPPAASAALGVRHHQLRCLHCGSATLGQLAVFADRSAEPEVASCMSVVASDVSLLEWFDLPLDPINVSLATPEHRVGAFARRLRVAYRQAGG